MDWQPIETAPRDGTPFLALNQFSDKEEPEVIQVQVWDDNEQGLVRYIPFVKRGISRPCIHLYPTHWMPLPQPPKDRG